MRRLSSRLFFLVLLVATVSAVYTPSAYSQEVTIMTSADDFDTKFFGEGVLQVVITDQDSDDSNSVEDITVSIDADPDSGSGGSGSFAIPETSESSGRFEFYLMHVDADDVTPGDIDPINTAGVEGSPGAGSTAAPIITFGPGGADLVLGAEDPYEEVSFTITVGNAEISVDYQESIADLTLDRSSYGSDNFVYVSIHDNDANKNPTAVDEFTVDPGAGPNSDLFDLSGGQITQSVVFRETGDNTAVFKGRYQLGSSINVSSESLVLLLNDKANYGATLSADENDSNYTVEVSFTIGDTSGGLTVNEGQQTPTFDPVFSLAKTEYRIGENILLTITDPDANTNANTVDSIAVKVRALPSNTESQITAAETGANTGIFEADFMLSESDGAPGKLQIQDGDNRITIIYADQHPAAGGQKEFTKQIGIMPVGREGIDATTSGKPILKDVTGRTLSSLSVGQQAVLSSAIQNNNDVNQPFVALVEVRDSQGVTVFLEWQTGTLNPNDQAEVGLSWTPDKQGSYQVRTFVVSDLAEQVQVLSPVAESVVTVS